MGPGLATLMQTKQAHLPMCITDIFVEAIDVMTNITKKVKRKDPRTGGESVLNWN
jgi:hypothetical protein